MWRSPVVGSVPPTSTTIDHHHHQHQHHDQRADGLKSAELVGKISEKLQILLKRTIELNYRDQLSQVDESERDELVDELVRRVTELQSSESLFDEQQQQYQGDNNGNDSDQNCALAREQFDERRTLAALGRRVLELDQLADIGDEQQSVGGGGGGSNLCAPFRQFKLDASQSQGSTAAAMLIDQRQQQQQAVGAGEQQQDRAAAATIGTQLAQQLAAVQQQAMAAASLLGHQHQHQTDRHSGRLQQQQQQLAQMEESSISGDSLGAGQAEQQAHQAAAQLAQRLSQQSQIQHQHLIENYLMRQRQQQAATLEQLRTISSCSNESNNSTSSYNANGTHTGRSSSIGDHYFLEPLDHLMDCTTASSSSQLQYGANSTATSNSCTTTASTSPCSLFSRLTWQLRLLESPSDSGVESGKENGGLGGTKSALSFVSSSGFRSATPNGGSSSACMSPINGLSAHQQHHLAMADALYHYTGHRAPSLSMSSGTSSISSHIRNLVANCNLNDAPTLAHQHQDGQQHGGQHESHFQHRYQRHQPRPASAMSQRQLTTSSSATAAVAAAAAAAKAARNQHSSAPSQSAAASNATGGSIEDMPMLKRALQAPPLINTNMLMDEAYRHHKKFRAAQRGRDLSSDQQAVCSTSGASSVASNHGPSCGASSSGSPVPRSPSPTTTSGTSLAGLGGGGSGTSSVNGRHSSNSNRSRGALADMHSTLLKKLNQPNQMSKKQLKCNDLISDIILRRDDGDADDADDDNDDGDFIGRHDDELADVHAAASVSLEGADANIASSDSRDAHRPRLEPPPAGQLQLGPGRSPIPSGTVAPASSPVSNSSEAPGSLASSPPLGPIEQRQRDDEQRLALRANLQNILISGTQKQQQLNGANSSQSKRLQLLGGLSHHLVDEDYIARRLLGSGAFRRSQQAHKSPESPAGSTGPAGPLTSTLTVTTGPQQQQHRPDRQKTATSGAHNQHRPSSSCASLSSPSPTSSLSTLSHSPSSSSTSPDLGMISQCQLAPATLGTSNATTPLTVVVPTSNQYLSEHLSQAQQRDSGSRAVAGDQLSRVVASASAGAAPAGGSSCDALIVSAHSTASSSPVVAANSVTLTASGAKSPSGQLPGSLSQISRLSLQCNGAALNSDQPANKLTSGAIFKPATATSDCGNFGLLADVAIATAAAEEQSRMESLMRLEQQQLVRAAAVAAVAAAAQPMDLSKK